MTPKQHRFQKLLLEKISHSLIWWAKAPESRDIDFDGLVKEYALQAYEQVEKEFAKCRPKEEGVDICCDLFSRTGEHNPACSTGRLICKRCSVIGGHTDECYEFINQTEKILIGGPPSKLFGFDITIDEDLMKKEGLEWRLVPKNQPTPKQEPKKRWRASETVDEAGKYFFIYSDGTIGWSWESGTKIDKNRHTYGNYFPTREAAEKKLEEIKKILLAHE